MFDTRHTPQETNRTSFYQFISQLIYCMRYYIYDDRKVPSFLFLAWVYISRFETHYARTHRVIYRRHLYLRVRCTYPTEWGNRRRELTVTRYITLSSLRMMEDCDYQYNCGVSHLAVICMGPRWSVFWSHKSTMTYSFVIIANGRRPKAVFDDSYNSDLNIYRASVDIFIKIISNLLCCCGIIILLFNCRRPGRK